MNRPVAVPTTDARQSALVAWLESLKSRYGIATSSLRPASVDASFRRYFRVDAADGSLIVMDAPPETEDSRPYVHVAALMKSAHINVPEIFESDLAKGFLLLSDLGSTTYLSVLNEDNASRLFHDAIDTIIRWQLATRSGVLPPYDEALLRRELRLFPDWYVTRHLQRTLTAEQAETLEDVCTRIVAANLAQPKVFVHRDYMPRNLMVSAPNPGVLDFQDAVIGPIAYDVVSLFRDAFISWDDDRVREWCEQYWQQAQCEGLPVHADFDRFWRDFEWMG
ncbi:MAG: aminoglycoside phosphotransferase family protein, partial [Burkholderiaceae bacterium]